MTFELNSDQERAASTLDRDVIVTAGAGSGKTRMLTQRFINAVVPGRVEEWTSTEVDRIVAITFTDKAAGELAERVRISLRDEGFVDEARRVDGAWVSTIHGLCSRLLRRHALEAGVDPLFEVADTVVAGRMRAEAFELAATRLVESDADVAGLLDSYSYNRAFDAAVALTRELAVRGLTAADIELEPAEPLAVLLDRAIELFSDGRTACDDYTGTAKAAAKFSDSCADLLDRVLELRDSAPDELRGSAELASIVCDYKPVGVARGLENAREESMERGEALAGDVGAALVAPHARGLLAIVVAFSAEFAKLKKSAGVLDFDDLQVEAVRLLHSQPALSESYRQKFRLVMIDEFQDTDALQLRLVEALSRNDLCTVGDEKQSIYRFRGADIGVYRQHREEMGERDALTVSLGVNYRSHESILAFVNAVFSSQEYFAGDLLRLTPPGGGRPPQPADGALGTGPRVEALFVDSSGGDATFGRRAEARAVASRLAELRDGGIDPGDMVILLRAYSNAHVYAEALGVEGVPAIIVGGSRFFGLEEISIMRALTRAIANPADGSAIGELLASEFCPVSGDGLARLRLAPEGRDTRTLWTILCDTGRGLEGDDGAAVRRLVDILESARRETGLRPLQDVLLQAVEDAGYDIRLLSRGNPGRDAFANVMKFVRQAAAYESGEGTGPAGFSAYLDAKELLGDGEAPASVADDGSNAVRIMSVHASKGLEFPIVVVADLASSGRGDSQMIRTVASADGLRVALTPPPAEDGKKPPKGTWAKEFARLDGEADSEEGNRVLYVAFTRARDLLIASGSMNMRPKGESKSAHHLLRLARLLGVTMPISDTSDSLAALADEGEGAPCRVRVLDAVQVLSAPEGEGEADVPTECAIPLAGGTRFAGDPPALASPDRVSYSSMHLFEQCPRRFLVEDVLRLTPVDVPEPGVPDPMRFGSAMHAALQLVDRDGRPPDDQRFTALGRQYELDESQLERLRRAVQRFVGSVTAGRAIRHERVARELSFALPIAGGACVLAGTIDLYARSGRGAMIVDYKSGTSGTASELVRRYELQAKCYALAGLVDGCESVEVVFVRPEVVGEDGVLQEVFYRFDSENEAALRDTVEALYKRIAESAYEPLPARDETICGYCAAPVGLCANACP